MLPRLKYKSFGIQHKAIYSLDQACLLPYILLYLSIYKYTKFLAFFKKDVLLYFSAFAHVVQNTCILIYPPYDSKVNTLTLNFSGTPVDKNPPYNMGDTGLTDPWSGKISHAGEYLGYEPQLLKPMHTEPVLHNKRRHHNKKLMHYN